MKIIQKEVQPTLAVKGLTAMQDIPAFLAKAYGEIAEYGQLHNIQFTGAPYAMYFNMDMDNLEIEAGFPVAGIFEGSGNVICGNLPGGRQFMTTHTGPYDGLAQTYDKVSEYAEENNIAFETTMYEQYLNSPEETEPEKLVTEIYFIIKED